MPPLAGISESHGYRFAVRGEPLAHLRGMTSTVAIGLLTIALLAPACGDGDALDIRPVPQSVGLRAVTEARCETMRACECSVPEDCADTRWQDQVDRIMAEGSRRGLAYDPWCVGVMVAVTRDRACETNDQQEPVDCDLRCTVFVGQAEAGMRCDLRELGSECERGLVCFGGFCQPACGVEAGESCADPNTICAEGLQCVEQRCTLRPQAGEPCQNGGCAEGLWCDPADPDKPICRSPAALGQACRGHDECESGNCPAGSCAPRPGLGEPCFGSCADGLFCVGTCETDPDSPPAICHDGSLRLP